MVFLPIMPDFVIDNAKQAIDIREHGGHGGTFTEDFLQGTHDKHFLDDNGMPKYTLDAVDPNPAPAPYRPSASGLTPRKVAQVDFINAELAKHYRMSKATAYQEALLNTSYQREVQDMKAAGLNPAVLYGAGRANGADTSLYPSEPRSGGGGGRSRRRYGRSSSNGKLFSSSAYAAIQAIGGLVGLATTKNPTGFWVGSQTAKGAMGFLDAIMNR